MLQVVTLTLDGIRALVIYGYALVVLGSFALFITAYGFWQLWRHWIKHETIQARIAPDLRKAQGEHFQRTRK